MKILRKKLVRTITNNLLVCVVFIGVFMLTYNANLELSDKDSTGTEPNAAMRQNVRLHSAELPDGQVISTEGAGVAEGGVAAPVAPDNRLLLVIFTSLKNTTDRDVIQSNTIRNWAQYIPTIQPVIYSTFESGPILKLAKQYQWHVHKAPRTNKFGTPFLKEMFIHAMNHYDAEYFGFCNGDILFDAGLTETLRALRDYLPDLGHRLIIGKRKNFYMTKYTPDMGPLWRQDVTSRVGRKEANFFTNDAEDYFFISKQLFNWTGMKSVVIGRPAYDNYFVALARSFGLSVVDATKTLLALHQTGKDGKFAGAKNRDSRYNRRVIGSFNYHKGMINRAAYYETMSDLYGRVFLKRSGAGWKQWRRDQAAAEGLAPPRDDNATSTEGLGETGLGEAGTDGEGLAVDRQEGLEVSKGVEKDEEKDKDEEGENKDERENHERGFD